MKTRLLNYLACPKCRAALEVEGGVATDTVDEGTLVCSSCRERFPVRNGIPRFPIAGDNRFAKITSRTREMYHYGWSRFGKPGHEQPFEKDSYRFQALIPRELMSSAGRVGLDAGCGAGLDLAHIADGGAEIIGIDVSTGVDVANEQLRHRQNVHLVQGDLNAPPFKAGCFDFIYSFGVLHHLADTRAGFENLSRLLKAGAPLITYLYESFDDRSRTEQLALSVVGGFRKLTIRIPAAVLYGLCWLASPLVWLTCSAPARILAGPFPALAQRIPYRHTLRWNVLASDLYDRFSPPVERRFTEGQVRELYRGAGLGQVEVRWHRGWVAWGRKVNAIP
jgi:SAM-dependent methyltransferase/uncharacterized protein YbaR (Trm112 family)